MDNNTEKKDMKLDSEQRVRVLSPGMLVAKRFLRNKLAIAGVVIIVCMFLFAFVGGLMNPYSQSQVFYTTDEMKKDYAGATKISDYQIYAADGVTLPSDAFSKTILAATTQKYVFETKDGSQLGLGKVSDTSYIMYEINGSASASLADSTEYQSAAAAGQNVFTKDGKSYLFTEQDGQLDFYTGTEMAVVCQLSFTGYTAETQFSYDFYRNAIVAMADGETGFTADDSTYTIKQEGKSAAMVEDADGKDYAYISNMNINSVVDGVFLTPSFKEAVVAAIEDDKEEFTAEDKDGNDETYLLSQKDGQYTIKRYQETKVVDSYASPSKAHWVGTDANGMDLLARLMYGGRISLLIGFVVVAIEVVLGVFVGGIAGFFGGWVDNVLMRFVDVVYCIPAIPLYMILGSIMDYYKVSATGRIYMLCIVMSILGWVGIARIVRGQILSLREQEFMIAAEATGISVRRRIFRHLIPNVIPQLIVFATMGLGDVILSEATLSFLGLGIKYPAASWGSIINAVNDSYVMTNYVFVWIPAGILILLTVLAFNFIGDGLRDAFDPKMKR